MNALILTLALLGQLNTPIVTVRHPWDGTNPVVLPSVTNPLAMRDSDMGGGPQTGGQLVLHKLDGTVEVLDAAPPGGNINHVSPGQVGGWWFYDKRTSLAGQWNIYRVNVVTKEIVQVTPDGSGHNIQPDCQGGQVVWTSTRDGFRSNGSFVGNGPGLNWLIYTSDFDGKNVECINRWSLGSAFHPTFMPNGRIAWTESGAMGGRSILSWGIFAMGRDGTDFEPLLSAYNLSPGDMTFRPDGRIVYEFYYTPNQGMGTIYEVNPYPTGSPATPSRFVSTDRTGLLGISLDEFKQPFMTAGARGITLFGNQHDTFSKVIGGVRQGFTGDPSWCSDGVLCALTGSEAPIYPHNWRARHGRQRICLIPDGEPLATADQMTVLLDDPAWTYAQPRAIEAKATPPATPWFKNDGTACPAHLPPGTPFALLGSASTLKREWLEWLSDWREGSQIPATVADGDIKYIRVYHLRPSPVGIAFEAFAGERLEILADIPVRNVMPNGDIILDGDGNPDTSWLAKIPGGVSLTLAALNENKEHLAFARLWRGFPAGTVNVKCGGCHNHTKAATPWESTLAYRFLQGTAEAPFQIWDATKPKPALEYARDIKPILDGYGLTANVYRGTHATEVPGFNVLPCRALRSSLYTTLPAEVTPEHKAAILQWIETGAQVGGLADDMPPIVPVSSPNREQATPIDKLQFAAYDLHGTIASTSVKASFEVAGRPPQSELADLFAVADYVHTLAIPEQASGEVTFTATDSAGKVASLTRTFPSGAVIEPPDPNAARIAEILARLDELAASDAAAQATLAANAAERASLLEELEGLQ